MKRVITAKTYGRYRSLIGSVLIVTTIGVALLLGSHAASPFSSKEVEAGTLANGAVQQTDTTASGGKYVQFGTAQVTPPSWDGSADKGLPGSWNDIQDGPHNSVVGDTLISIVNSSFQSGHEAFQFTVNTGGQRAELASALMFNEGDKLWIGDILYIPSGQTWVRGHHTLMQLKNDGTGSPPLELDLRSQDVSVPGLNVSINDTSGNGQESSVIPMANLFDRALRIELGVTFSSNPAVGQYEIWVNGTQVIPPTHAATLFSGLSSYFKEGQYGEADGNTVYWAGAYIGPTHQSVLR